MSDINDPGATHYYGDGCDDDHGRADHLHHGSAVYVEPKRFLVLPNDLYDGTAIEFHHSINIATVRVFHAGAVYRLLPDDDGAERSADRDSAEHDDAR